MKKIQVALLLTAASAMMLAGCGDKSLTSNSGSNVVGSTATTGKTTNNDTEETIVNSNEISAATETSANGGDDENVPPKEGMVRSKLTNDWIDEALYNQRPLAVMIPNESSAIPHYGLSEASILYECNVEANMTRLLAIFEDYESIEKLGNVRSLRDYYTYWAFEWDAIICHFAGPYYIDEVMAKSTTDSLNGNILSSPFFRSSDRSAPHNAYLNGTQVKSVLEKLDIDIYDRGLADETHYNFTTVSNPNTLTQYKSAEDAAYVDMSACYPVTKCYFEYNEDDGLYYRSQYLSNGTDGPHIDGANGKQLTFTNILIESHDYATRDQKGYLWYETVDSGRDAWYITQGKIIKCTWEKASEFGATRYYDENGDEIILNTGKTMVLIIQDGDTFHYE